MLKKRQELSKLQLTPGPQDPLDHVGAREWLEKVYQPLPKTPKLVHQVREPVEIRIHDVVVNYESQEGFNIRVYEPQTPGREESELYPAVLAYHGGGWIHGYSRLEDGEAIPSLHQAETDTGQKTQIHTSSWRVRLGR